MEKPGCYLLGVEVIGIFKNVSVYNLHFTETEPTSDLNSLTKSVCWKTSGTLSDHDLDYFLSCRLSCTFDGGKYVCFDVCKQCEDSNETSPGGCKSLQQID